MNITLAEDRNGVLQAEQSFAKPVVTVGRESDVCDLVFAKDQFPMVSRKHAEIRFENGQWYLVDLKSSYGTFLNSHRVDRPMVLPAGSAIQFGTDGPILKVVWFDVSAEPGSASVPRPQARPAAVQPATPKVVQQEPPKPAAVPMPAARLEFTS